MLYVAGAVGFCVSALAGEDGCGAAGLLGDKRGANSLAHRFGMV